MDTVLVVDDDQRLLNMLARTLTYEGFDVLTAVDGQAALAVLRGRPVALIVLDWLLPGLDGLSLVEALRAVQDDTPILMLTARDAIEDRVRALDGGADDYLVKPFAPAELLARIRALLRRLGRSGNGEPLCYADLGLNPVTREARRGTSTFGLTPTEFDLLHFFLRHPRQVLRREQILDAVWGYDYCGDGNVLEVYVGYLRRKMEADGAPRLLQTVRGVGYVLREA
jgi:two-component system response regulator MprA